MLSQSLNPVGTNVDLTRFGAELAAYQVGTIAYKALGLLDNRVLFIAGQPVAADGEIFYMSLGSIVLRTEGLESTLIYMHDSWR